MNNMKIKLLLLPILAFALQACNIDKTVKNNDNYVNRNISVNDFTDICIESSDVYFTQGAQTSVKITGNEEDIKQIKIYNKDNTLHIEKVSKNLSLMSLLRNPRNKINVFVTSPNLRGVHIMGSGNLCAEKGIDTDRMKIKITGSGYVEMKSIICDLSSIDIMGSGSINIDNITTAQSNMRIMGSGSINISKSAIKNVAGNISGSGSIELDNANIGYAKSEINGSGSIDIQGRVKKHDDKVNGQGSINIR